MISREIQKAGYFAPLCTARHVSVRFYDWEPSQYTGDLSHLVALCLCLVSLLREEGTRGVSFKTHILFLLVFSLRFLNIFFCKQPVYVIISKVLIWQCTLMIVMVMCIRGSVRDTKDTLPICALLLPTLVITLFCGGYSLEDHGLAAEILWIGSNYLEGIAMFPQYVYCYQDDDPNAFVVAYVTAMGLYQMIFGVHWIVRLAFGNPLVDLSSLINGALGVVFFFDYAIFKIRGMSPLSGACIFVDKGLQEVRDIVCSSVSDAWRRFSGTSDLIAIPTQFGSHPPTPIGKSPVEIEHHDSRPFFE